MDLYQFMFISAYMLFKLHSNGAGNGQPDMSNGNDYRRLHDAGWS